MNLKRLAKRALATLSLSMLCLVAFAQGHQISGTVIDGTGEPIIGANVLEVGTTNGVITDIDGNFKLSVQPNAKIQVSFIRCRLRCTEEVGCDRFCRKGKQR